jgi:hypothetical protein
MYSGAQGPTVVSGSAILLVNDGPYITYILPPFAYPVFREILITTFKSVMDASSRHGT